MPSQEFFTKVAPFLQEPLVLVGFALFLGFSFCRLLIAKKILPPLPPGKGFKILQLILTYGFLLGLLIIALGFGLKYREMSAAEQKRVMLLIEGEVHANLKTAEAMGLNVENILQQANTVSDLLRRPDIPLMASLFPPENRHGSEVPTLDLARTALAETKKLRTQLPSAEAARLAEVATALRNALRRTRATMENLADRDRKRYVFSRTIWSANESILRKISVQDVTPLQESYARLEPLRSEYDVVLDYSLAFLDSLSQFLDPKNTEPQEQSLATVLGSERNLFKILPTYGTRLADELERLVLLRQELAKLKS